MDQTTTIIFIVSAAIIIFLIRNHFTSQQVNTKIFVLPLALTVVFIAIAVKYPDLKYDSVGFLLRFMLGMAIGVLQGCLARVYESAGGIVSVGTKIGLAFWLIFVPVRLFVLPWFSTIAPGYHNLQEPDLLGISALCIFIGFFLSKGITLLVRKARLMRNKIS